MVPDVRRCVHHVTTTSAITAATRLGRKSVSAAGRDNIAMKVGFKLSHLLNDNNISCNMCLILPLPLIQEHLSVNGEQLYT